MWLESSRKVGPDAERPDLREIGSARYSRHTTVGVGHRGWNL
jgi:hypothetical protein